MIDSNPMIIIISDTHLGASGARYSLFEKLLIEIMDKIKSDEQFKQNFKSLIILGDFCDLLCDSFKDIGKDFQQMIFEKIDFLIENDISVPIILGNHDLSVSGDFDKKFRKRYRR